MERTPSRKQARARLLERQRDAAAAREARERADIGDLTEFTVQAARVDEIDGWLAEKTAALNAEAERRRGAYRVSAGKALQRMRLRGETVPAIAEAAGVSSGRVRELRKTAARSGADDQPEIPVPAQRVSRLPTLAAGGTGVRSVHAQDATARQGV